MHDSFSVKMNNPAASSGVSNLWKDLKAIAASGGEFNPKRLNFLICTKS